MNTDLMFSSVRSDWETPPELFEKYHRLHHFSLDVCANSQNAKLPNFLDVAKVDALKEPWTGRCFCNPPYGRGIEKWVKKAHDSVFIDKTAELVLLLIPARVDTKWFHEYIYNPRDFNAQLGTRFRFLKGRVKFLIDGKKTHPAPFPSMVVLMEREAL